MEEGEREREREKVISSLLSFFLQLRVSGYSLFLVSLAETSERAN
jgi:hypothetical protein